MDQKNQMSFDYPSLLILNNDCLDEIFKFLQFEDFVNLAETCSRLFFVAQKCKKYKNIKVTSHGNASSCTVEEFSNNLSVIGEHVASVVVDSGNDDILKTIADACTNLRSAELGSFTITALPFRNLSELKVWYGVFLSTDEWKNVFQNNPAIVCLEYCHKCCRGRNKCLPLLQMLPELKSLTVDQMKPQEFHHLPCLTNLTRFSFTSHWTCFNQLLIDLAEKLNLVELEVQMPCDADTFAVLKLFRCLEVLSITNAVMFIRIPETAIFPSTLKKIQLDFFTITCSVFLSVVKRLKLLEEFDIGCGQILWGNDETEYFPTPSDRSGDFQGSRIISRITKELRAEKHKLKIIFDHVGTWTHRVWKYSDNLEIIQRRDYVKKVFDHTFKLHYPLSNG